MVHGRARMIRSTMVDDYATRLTRALGGNTPDRIKDLANALGLTYNAVKKVVMGDSNFFSVPNHFKAARHLNVRPEWLGLGEEPMRETARESSAADAVDYRTLALMIIAEHHDAEARDLMLRLIDLVDIKAAQLRQVAGQRAVTHTP